MGVEPVQEARTTGVVLKCPVCSATFRGAEICTRCGTDLRLLMRLAARAWAKRQAARSKLRTGQLTAAMLDSAAAWKIQQYPATPTSLLASPEFCKVLRRATE